MTVNERRLSGNTDAAAWADEFCREPATRILIGDDEASRDLMRSWFANAIETGRDAGITSEQARQIPDRLGDERLEGLEIQSAPWHWRWDRAHNPRRCALCWLERLAVKLGLAHVEPDTAIAVAVRRCRSCGCTDDRACPGGCYLVADDLCSACAG